MKLTNPTDQELDAAFAEHVAGWKNLKLGVYGAGAPERNPSWHGTPPTRKTGVWSIPSYTRSFDAVLPYLEKEVSAELQMLTFMGHEQEWRVSVKHVAVKDKSLPRAAVICLLRANGVEVISK